MVTDANQGLWDQVSRLRPVLRRNIVVEPQEFRGIRWYLLHDTSAGRFLRINSAAYEIVGRFDADHSILEIVDICKVSRSDNTTLDTNEVLGVLAQLHEFEALIGGLPLGAREALRRYKRNQEQQFLQRWGNPLSLRFSLFDPDRLLRTLLPLTRWVLSPAGVLLWVAILLSAITTVLLNHANLSDAIVHKSFGVAELVTVWVMYPLIKFLHELAHGIAIKRWGGEVHEMGIFLLVFMPIPYVDGSASWAFRDKRKRAIVSAAGIAAELFLAAIGLLIWTVTEAGLVNDLALNVTLIAGLSTLLYNGNPLLRFDGYHVLEDLIEIPNLASRSALYYIYLFQRYTLGLNDSVSPVSAVGERMWFIVYGLLSPLYRLIVLLAIALFLMQKYLVIGVVLASWAIAMQVIKPIVKALQYLFSRPQMRLRKVRSAAVVLIPLVLTVCALSIPVPSITRAQGVVWIGESAQVVAQSEGFVISVAVKSGDVVKQGDQILLLSNQALSTERQILVAKLAELRTRQSMERQKSRVLGEIAAADQAVVASQLRDLQQKLASMTITSPARGKIVFSDPHELTGKFINGGDAIAFIVQQNQPIVRAVVGQAGAGALRAGISSVEVMLADQIGKIHQATILRETPAGVSKLPSAVLGLSEGGSIRTNLSDSSGMTTESEIFQLDLALPPGAKTSGLGGRAYVKLFHKHQPLWLQWSHSIRRLLLARLAV